jgi:hypothetical protein
MYRQRDRSTPVSKDWVVNEADSLVFQIPRAPAAFSGCVAGIEVIVSIAVLQWEVPMAETKQPRESISTRIDPEARDVIERVAAARRTTLSQVARVLLEDAAKQLAGTSQAA